MYRGTRLRGARILITGGASGIGRLMALEAARRRAEVIIWDLSEEGGTAVAAEIVGSGGLASSYQVDVTDAAHVREVARQTGDVDVVVNNAGVVSGQPLLEASEEALRRTLEVNTLALYWVTRAFLPGMIQRRGGTVVTIASAAGLIGVARQTDYSASKFGALGFTESLRAELRADGHGVGTLVVCPYYINTGMFDGVETRFPFLLPILEEHDVALKVIDGIESGREQIILPPFARLVPLMRFLPTRAFDRVADFFGINKGMDHFVGRAGVKAR
ncbi:SDR family oxidoreductase [Sinomonas cellulolyticus]|uniref:SDR family oxidoreductase n=1 Tax=Sinomonas cellulolyticus TaxID=2801916 RepID=A0ABS1JX76_9MICC|nr:MULTISPECIES: SDR family oxidoreductase [Sinomonas]MBL0703904.1 SDR family oxidoreductase [Sinomonas cellulolyticus]